MDWPAVLAYFAYLDRRARHEVQNYATNNEVYI
jgi:hypothetical protein